MQMLSEIYLNIQIIGNQMVFRVGHTFFLFLPFKLVFLKFFGQLLFLLLLYITVQVFGGVAECWGEQDLAVLTQFISDPDEEVLQLHRILKDLRVRPATGPIS